MGRRWPLTIKVKGLVRPIATCKENQTILECGKEVTLHSQREVRAKGIDRAFRLTQEEQTSLECWKDVTHQNQSAVVMTKEKQTNLLGMSVSSCHSDYEGSLISHIPGLSASP